MIIFMMQVKVEVLRAYTGPCRVTKYLKVVISLIWNFYVKIEKSDHLWSNSTFVFENIHSTLILDFQREILRKME